MKKIALFILILCSLLEATSEELYVEDGLSEQEISFLKAVVLDKNTNEPVPFAHVFINQTTCGTYTTIDGVFELKCDFDITDLKLFISHVGYEDIIIEINSTWENDIVIPMIPAANELKEITILSDRDDKSRKRNLRIFKNEFIGRDKSRKKCFIENPEVIYFNDSLDVLWAFSDAPIQVTNLYTGYKIEYHLEYFAFNKKTTLPMYSGNCSIQEMDTSDFELKQKWIDQRKTSYMGSLTHFFHSLLSENLNESGYSLLNEKSLKIDIDNKEENTIVSVSENIDVVYENEFEPRSYRTWLNRVLSREPYVGGGIKYGDDPRYQVTSVSPINGKILINKNGQILNEKDIVLNGYMGWERVADIMPFNYKIQQ
ncbi:MAG: carboxypeptidase-like regulatory domain-containing protein [Ekhidna sp.]